MADEQTPEQPPSEFVPDETPCEVDPEDLLAMAKNGEKLQTLERRHVIVYLDSTDGDSWSNYELARLFKVSETQIRKDRKTINKAMGESLTPKQAVDFVSEYVRNIRLRIRQGEAALRQLRDEDRKPIAGQTHVMYLRLLSDLEERLMGKLQEIEVVPKSLGRLNVKEETWVAKITDSDIPSVEKLEDPTESESESIEPAA